jgi:hypothetical protein
MKFDTETGPIWVNRSNVAAVLGASDAKSRTAVIGCAVLILNVPGVPPIMVRGSVEAVGESMREKPEDPNALRAALAAAHAANNALRDEVATVTRDNAALWDVQTNASEVLLGNEQALRDPLWAKTREAIVGVMNRGMLTRAKP